MYDNIILTSIVASNLEYVCTRGAMIWGEHWRQRLSLGLARGQADLVLTAVRRDCVEQFGKGQGTQGFRGVVLDGLSALYRLALGLALARSIAQPQTPSPPYFLSRETRCDNKCANQQK